MSKQTFKNNLLDELEEYLSPLVEIYQDDTGKYKVDADSDTAIAFFRAIGWNLDKLFDGSVNELIDHLNVLVKAIQDIYDAIKVLSKSPPEGYQESIREIVEIAKEFKNMADAFKEFNDDIKTISKSTTPKDVDLDWNDLADDTVNGLTLIYIRRRETLYHILALLNIIEDREIEIIRNEDGEILRIKNNLPKVNLSNLKHFIDNPKKHLKSEYLADQQFSDYTSIRAITDRLFPKVANLLYALGFDSYYGAEEEYLESLELDEKHKEQLKGMLTFFRGGLIDEEGDFRKGLIDENEAFRSNFGASAGLLSNKSEDGGPGVFVIPFGNLKINYPINNWLLSFYVDADIRGFKITKNDFSLIGTTDVKELSLSLARFKADKDDKFFQFGKEGRTKLDVDSVSFYGKLHKEASFREYLIELAFTGIHLAIERPESKGFLSKLIPKNGIHSQFDLTIGWSSIDDIYFQGNGGLEFVLSLHKRIGPIELQEVAVRLYVSKEGINLAFGFEVKGDLGPTKFALADFGLASSFSFTDENGDSGNFGLVNFDSPEFMFPSRIGIAIDSGLIVGGGYLEFDRENDRFAGILSLSMRSSEFTGICLISNRLPNNKKGYSMLVSINVTFNPVIQLPYGFTWNGIGGLIGINRSLKVDILRSHLASGTIESILFPKNVIENADKIISDLRTVFPPQEGHHVLAPFLKIGWNTFLELDLGIILESQMKNRLILIGNLTIILPSKDAALVDIHVNILGDFNFAEEYIRIEGVLRNSQVVGIPLNGGFAFVLSWDSRPQFLLSVGGYHPQYKKPPRFPNIRRLQALIQDGEFKLSCAYYQAITSNSFQIGLSVSLFVKESKFIATGDFSFDALIVFDPFYFETLINMSAHLRYGRRSFAGITLRFFLSGPKPWRVNGYAKIRIMRFFKIKIRFSYNWGGEQHVLPNTLPSAFLLEKLKDQLSLPHNWSARLPEHFVTAETLRSIDEENKDVVLLHPSGYLEVRQTVVPLGQKIKKYGNSMVDGSPTYRITKITLGNLEIKLADMGQLEPVKEYFAPGQFKELTAAQKLSSPDFELFDAGYSFSHQANIDIGKSFEKANPGTYEEIVIDENLEILSPPVTRSIASQSGQQHEPMRQPIRFSAENETTFSILDAPPLFEDEEQYYIVSKENFGFPENGMDTPFSTRTEASDYLEDELQNEKNDYQIITATYYRTIFDKEAA